MQSDDTRWKGRRGGTAVGDEGGLGQRRLVNYGVKLRRRGGGGDAGACRGREPLHFMRANAHCATAESVAPMNSCRFKECNSGALTEILSVTAFILTDFSEANKII
jgi:hypothetical protein